MWSVYQWLSGPSLQRFGLSDHALQLLGLDGFTEEELVDLIEGLNGCLEGESKAIQIINKPKVSQSGKDS